MRLVNGRRAVIAAVLAVACSLGSTTVAGAAGSAPAPVPTGDPAAEQVAQYEVSGDRSPAAIARMIEAGVAIDRVAESSVIVSADPAQAVELGRLGFEVSAPLPGPTTDTSADRPNSEPQGPDAFIPGDFPARDSGYHNFAELNSEINGLLAAHPDLMSRQVIGRSVEGRDIAAIKISDNVGADEDEPEILFTHQQHAREHLTVEMALYLMRELTGTYATDGVIRNLVDNREIWIVPTLNPDGSEWDIATGNYRMWRKNRQPNAGATPVGTDLNRNWDFRWGCCGGSSGSPSSDTYRGSAPESGREVKVVADFVRSRVVDGTQQIRASIDFHTYSELVMWPYGYTNAATAPGLTSDDAAAYRTLGEKMAASNGYTPQQSSRLYITDGSISDWLWADQGIFAFAFELYPNSEAGGGFYPGDEIIARETARNRQAVVDLLEVGDCVYRITGKQDQYCPGGSPARP